MSWSVGVTTDDWYLLVTDTYNDRILIWNGFLTQNEQATDYVVSSPDESCFVEENIQAIAWL